MWSEIDLEEVSNLRVTSKVRFEKLGFADTSQPESLTFAENELFLKRAIENSSVVAVLTTLELSKAYSDVDKVIACEDPQYTFFTFHNSAQKQTLEMFPSEIHPSAVISNTAIIEPHNVIIGRNTIVEDYCVLKANTKIGEGSRIQSGSIIGATGIYAVKNSKGQRFLADHFGSVEIGDSVDIGSHSVIDKGIFPADKTLISSHNFIGPLSNIGHGAQLQKGNTLAVGVKICGYTKIGMQNWIGPDAVVSHRLDVGSRNYISLGATLLKSIGDDTKVIGNKIFADRTLF